MRILLISLVLFTFDINRNRVELNEDPKINDWFYTYSLARIYNSDERAKLYANFVEFFSHKFNINSRILARLIYKESKYRERRKSYTIIKNKKIIVACGPMMVRPTQWDFLLYRHPEIAKKLLNSDNPEKAHVKYLTTIYYGMYSGCHVLSNYISKTSNDYKLALTAYWAGPRSKQYKQMKRNKSNHYVNDIYNKNLENEINRFYPEKWWYNITLYPYRKRLYQTRGNI